MEVDVCNKSDQTGCDHYTLVRRHTCKRIRSCALVPQDIQRPFHPVRIGVLLQSAEQVRQSEPCRAHEILRGG